MISKEKLAYFNSTEFRDTRNDLKRAVALVGDTKIAIDCGCGAGSDIEYLRKNGFEVHAFDIEPDAIAICERRFKDDANIQLSIASFDSYHYPKASLIVADASLFFCSRSQFQITWQKIVEALLPNGVFVGSFLGPEDTMASAEYDGNTYWPEVLVTHEAEIKSWFDGFELESFSEHRSFGKTVTGAAHNWHLFSVIARKNPNK